MRSIHMSLCQKNIKQRICKKKESSKTIKNNQFIKKPNKLKISKTLINQFNEQIKENAKII